jgi:hypothetical protein
MTQPIVSSLPTQWRPIAWLILAGMARPPSGFNPLVITPYDVAHESRSQGSSAQSRTVRPPLQLA